MTEDVKNVTVWALHEESPHTPWFVGKRMHNLRAHTLRQLIGGIHVINLDRHSGHLTGSRVVRRHTQLSRGVVRIGQGDDPAVVHHLFETQEFGIELDGSSHVRAFEQELSASHSSTEFISNTSETAPKRTYFLAWISASPLPLPCSAQPEMRSS